MTRWTLLLLLPLAAACGPAAADVVPATDQAVPAYCAVRNVPGGVLPDATCTPGVTNPDVTQATIRTTICVKGWTAEIRPPSRYTSSLKRWQMSAYGESGPTSGFAADHLIPLEAGGDPRAVGNIWPETLANSKVKDKVENAAHAAICSGKASLDEVRAGFSTDWVALGRQLGAIR